MKKYLFLIALMSICIVNAQNITQTEIVGRPTNNSITIQAFFDAAVQVSIQYGTVSGTYPNQTPWQSFAVNDPAEVVISGLSPNTKYYYKLNYRAPNATTFTSRPEHFFQTQRPPGSSFSFVVQADPHMDEQSSLPIYDRCLQNQLEDNPDFMIDLGDFLMTDKLKNDPKFSLDMSMGDPSMDKYLGRLTDDNPIFEVIKKYGVKESNQQTKLALVLLVLFLVEPQPWLQEEPITLSTNFFTMKASPLARELV